MKTILHYISALCPLVALLTACSTFEVDSASQIQGEPTDDVYVSLTIDVASGEHLTRADEQHPFGGEEGDGWEYGLDNENRLYDFTVFVLRGAVINSPGSTPIVGSRYVSEDEVNAIQAKKENIPTETYTYPNKDVLTYDFTIPLLHGPIEQRPADGSLRFVIVANAGNLTGKYSSLGALRDGLLSQSFTAATADGQPASRFVMTNENDNYFTSGSGTQDDPMRLHIMIERLAARIDFNPAGATLAEDKSLRYDVKEDAASSDVLAHLYVDNMRIVNGSQVPSYLIKRVADDIDGKNTVYLGDELPVPSGVQTNYVIDPNTALKTVAAQTDNDLLQTLYGDSRLSQVSKDILALTQPDVDANPRRTFDDDSYRYILGYVNENTFFSAATSKSYATGVLIKCRYAPLHDYYERYDTVKHELPAPADYTPGQTFYLLELNRPTMGERQRFYFKTEDDAQRFADDQAKAKIVVGDDETTTTTAGEPYVATITKYTNGVCYYYIWLRHSDAPDDIHGTMEFATVRNNIYSFTIHATTGPGTAEPVAREPEGLKATIYVRKWREVVHPAIQM